MGTEWDIKGGTVRHLLRVNRRHGAQPDSAAALAARIGVSESYMSHLLAGRKRSFDRLLDIAAALDVEDWRDIATPRALEDVA